MISVPNPSTSLPVLSLADYTTARGVPTAISLANQANLTIRKADETSVQTMDENDMSSSMSTDEYTEIANQSSNSSINKSRRNKSEKSSSKSPKQTTVEPIQYGPIVVKPRKHIAPTLANGRRSKDERVRTISLSLLRSILINIV